jgi:hypothetical protein
LFLKTVANLLITRLNIFRKKILNNKEAATVKKNRKGLDLMQFIGKKRFKELVDKWEMDKGVREFSTWEMTGALITCLVFQLQSYRDVQRTLGVSKSTFGDAVTRRCFGFFHDLCTEVLLCIRARTKSRKIKRAIRNILAMDSSEITVHGSLFDTPGWQKKHSDDAHEASGKIHLVWNVDGEWVDDFVITPGRKADSPISLRLTLLDGKTYVFDRAYNDLSFWVKIIDIQSHFVSRLKDCAKNKALEKEIFANNKNKDGVLYDEIYKPSDALVRKHGLENHVEIKLRHIIYRDCLTKKIFHFVTSDLKCSAKTIAQIYKRRWAVELLFKWLKGHLAIRQLPVKKPNAIKIWLSVAVLIQLLLQLKKLVEKFNRTLWDLLAAIRSEHHRISLCSSGAPAGFRWSQPSEGVSGVT